MVLLYGVPTEIPFDSKGNLLVHVSEEEVARVVEETGEMLFRYEDYDVPQADGRVLRYRDRSIKHKLHASSPVCMLPDWKPNSVFECCFTLAEEKRFRSAAYFLLKNDQGQIYPIREPYFRMLLEAVADRHRVLADVMGPWRVVTDNGYYSLKLIESQVKFRGDTRAGSV